MTPPGIWTRKKSSAEIATRAVEQRAQPQGLAEGEERHQEAREIDEEEPHRAELQHHPAGLRLGRYVDEQGFSTPPVRALAAWWVAPIPKPKRPASGSM